MRRLHIGLLGAGMLLLVVSLALSGCKKAEEDEGPFPWQDLKGGGKASAAVAKTPVPMGKGVIKGKAVWKGPKPNLGQLGNDMLAAMNSKPDDKPVCLSPECSKDEKDQQKYRIGANDGVGNVVVWVTLADKNTYFQFTDDDLKALNLKEVKIEQPHCAFIPHVAKAFTHYVDPKDTKKLKLTSQNVIVLNDATISHNTKWADTGKIRGGNVLLPPTQSVQLPMVPETKPLQIQCSIHQWMDAFIWDFDHPYSAITKYDEKKPDDETYGTYVIRNVPTGVKLKIVAWHEDGQVAGADDIEVKEGETLEHNFEISKK